jgi:dihydroorotate dehydrogenase (NAD+) catalytic subunit
VSRETVDLRVDLAGLRLASPLLTAAGRGGRELAAFTDLGPEGPLGAVVSRTVTLDARAGAPPPRLVPTPSGLLHATGHQNPGLQGFLATELPWLVQQGARVVVSLAAATAAEHAELARRLATAPGVAAVEVQLDEPDPRLTGTVVEAVRRELPAGLPLLAALPPGGDTVALASAAATHGADAVVTGGGFPGLALDPATLRPALGSGPGVLGGPAVHALALRRVWELHAALPDLPLVAGGGVRSGFDALSLLAAGAIAVQLGSVLLQDPSAPARILAELADELDRRHLGSAAAAAGLAHDRPEGSSR